MFSLFAISRIILRAKDKKIKKTNALLWIVVFGAILVLSLMPKAMSIISKIFGVQRGVDLFIYISIILLFYLSFKVYMILETLNQDITKCVREIAILRYEYEERTKESNR